ncbi:MAG: hypothetical protein M3R25_07100, partial [Bacteroidota bacterium]|nr:hypothetical protein [Bacteroidota bacterium]
VQFKNLNFTPGTKMFIYNNFGTMLSGPITENVIYESKYSSDIIDGDHIIVSIFIPKKEFQDFNVEIKSIAYGFDNIYNGSSGRNYDDSGTCTIDVNCGQGFGFEAERDAVGLMIVDGERHCSGALINRTCQDMVPLFLTANHCIVNNDDDFDEYVYRFNYDSPDPTDLNNCRGSEPESWITFSGSFLRASWSTSDFALLELWGNVIGRPTLAMAGWDRNDYSPFETASIHNPSGDVKKISIDDDQAVIDGWQGSGTDHLRVSWDEGITEGGSSGAPLFDYFSHRIVGQLHGGTSFCSTPTDPDYYGRVFNSYTGGGTSSTRLSDWLGASTSTNTDRPPHITGASYICSSNTTLSLNNLARLKQLHGQ